jgi:hypothetical protein
MTEYMNTWRDGRWYLTTLIVAFCTPPGRGVGSIDLQLQALPWHRIASRRDLAWAWSHRHRQSVAECAAMQCEKTLELDSSVWSTKSVAAAAAEPTPTAPRFLLRGAYRYYPMRKPSYHLNHMIGHHTLVAICT